MSNSKHTPGPWQMSGDCAVATANEELDELICDCSGRKIDAAFFSDMPGRAEANARLIAAAPELLESCRELVTDLLSHASFGLNEKEVAMLRRAESAIAKADGATSH